MAYNVVENCPQTFKDWASQATLKCNNENTYHCVKDESSSIVEVCTTPLWIQKGNCPIYNTGLKKIVSTECTDPNCPSEVYRSDAVYKYNCYQQFSTRITTENTRATIPSAPNVVPIVGPVIAVCVVALLLVVVAIMIRRKRQCGFNIRENGRGDRHGAGEDGQYTRGNEKIPFDDFNLEKPFHKTSAFDEGVKFINNGGSIFCLVGQWGSGKRSTAKQVYVAVTNSSPIMIRDPLTFDVKDNNEPIIVDMTLSIGISNSEKEDLRKKIHVLFENISSSKAFIIFLIDEDRDNIAEFVRSIGKVTKSIELSESFTKEDRTQILYSQFKNFCQHKNFSEVEKLAVGKGKDHFLGYSEICVLFCRCTYFQRVGPVLFRNSPLQYLKSYLEIMHNSDKEKFLILVYMSLDKMVISVDNQTAMLHKILESCKCDSSKKKISSITEQNNITETEATEKTSQNGQGISSEKRIKEKYMSKEYITSIIPEEFVNKQADSSVYRLQHDIIKRMTLIVFGTYHFDKLLELSKPEELKSWVKEKGIMPDIRLGETKPVLEINGEKWRQYKDVFRNKT